MSLLLALILYAAPSERAVLIYPREHAWLRRIFYTSHQRVLQRELQKRFAVDVHDQVGTADALFNTDVRGAKLLVLSGHGSPFALSLQGRGDRTLDASQFARLKAFLSQLAPDATIVLQSCDTGLGFAWIVKRAAGPNRRVIAAKGEIPPDGLQITSLLPLDVTITCEGGWDCTLRL
jgi:hypothetical protein